VITLHVTNGDCAADTLRRFADGPVVITADVLHEGPAPPVEGDAWHDTRARYLSGGGYRYEDVRSSLAASDRAIADAGRRRDHIVLWFEHDLFDQLALIRVLDQLASLKADTPYDRGTTSAAPPYGVSRTVSLICIDRFPGIEPFIGLGQLDAAQLASLYPSRRPVRAEQFALASAAWNAFRSPDPTRLTEIARDARALPFLGDALRRFFAEFPSIENGLSRTEALALAALADRSMAAGELFAATQTQEPRPFMGDSVFYGLLRGLAAGRVPLLTIDAAPEQLDLKSHGVTITAAGRDVLAGRRDHIRVNGTDRWRGGVHLAGADRSPWRWDAHLERLVS
jgi:uncharacterized protein DUF1835